MSIERLFDHRVVVHRATPSRDELQDRIMVWAPLPAPAGRNARPNQAWSGSLQDHGPGEQQGAMRQWFLHKGFDAAERDVLEVVSGPEAGRLLRIESVTKPTNRLGVVHHLEVNVMVWDGDLSEPAGES